MFSYRSQSSHQMARHSICVLLTLVLSLPFYTSEVAAKMNTYFVINQPQLGTQWVNGQPGSLQWSKGLLDGVPMVDIELARLSVDGLQFVALNVPAQSGALNILMQDVPEGDDYYFFAENKTHSKIYAISSRFSIVNSTSEVVSSNATMAGPVTSQATGYGTNGAKGAVPTVTISGAPNPTKSFAATFSVIASSAYRNFGVGFGNSGVTLMIVLSMILGAVWTLL